MLFSTLILVTAALANEAWPEEGPMDLSWNVTAEDTLRYAFESSVQLPPERVGLSQALHRGASTSLDATLQLDCLPLGGQGLSCTVLDASLEGTGPATDMARRLAGAEASLLGATIDLTMADGRVIGVDVDTTDPMPSRHGPMVRTVVDLLTSGLDLELPGAVNGSVSWTQHRSALLPDATSETPLGRVALVHRATPTPLGLVRIATDGDIAWLQTGATFAVNRSATGRIEGTAWFDADRGVMLRREWTTRSADTSFQQVGRLVLIED